MKLCASCTAAMIDLLDRRIRKILEISHGTECEEDVASAQAQCFHLIEIRRILEGETTCGVFDDYGKPAAITGPLFDSVRPG